MPEYLSPDEARDFYDRFGERQNWQRWYEGPALRELVRASDFGSAHAVFELGCGPGALAAELLGEHLPEDAAYVAVDISPTMVALARKRLAPFGDRARVLLTDGGLSFDLPDGRFDRFVSAYVLDLLPPEQIAEAFREAHRLLRPGGKICLLGLTEGCTVASRAVVAGWRLARRINPRLVGGCRPLHLIRFAEPQGWRWDSHRVMSVFGVPSEVLVMVRH